MRLLGRKYLGNFNLVQKGTGDFENLVQQLYKTQKNFDIPGTKKEASERQMP